MSEPRRKKRRGQRKSKAERLARSSSSSSIVPSNDELLTLLRSNSSREWDMAQSLALRAAPEVRTTVVRVLLADHAAPRAAAHYAKRMNLQADQLLDAVASSPPLRVAQFLLELDETALATRDRLERFVWPWLQEPANKAAANLMLQPTAASGMKLQQARKLQRALLVKCLTRGKLLHLVLRYASTFYMEECSIPDDTDVEEECEEDRSQVAHRVENALRLLYPDARVLVFGSSATGLHTRTADVDLCALLPSAPQCRESASLIADLSEHLTLYLASDATAVQAARVPIVRFTDNVTQLPCDLCVNNVAALWNTRLLRRLLYGSTTLERHQFKPARRLCQWLRRWRSAKPRAVANGLSSYGLTLLALYYLQRVGIVPVLDCSALVVDTATTRRTLSSHQIDVALDSVPQHFVQQHKSSKHWQELRRGFFQFYTRDFDYERLVVSLRTSELMLKTEKDWQSPRLCLEDPVETTRDLGTLCSRRTYVLLRCAFVHACLVLSEENAHIEAELLTTWAYEHDSDE